MQNKNADSFCKGGENKTNIFSIFADYQHRCLEIFNNTIKLGRTCYCGNSSGNISKY